MKGLDYMGLNHEKFSKAYKKFIKWFGRVVFSIMYLMIITHFIIYRKPIIFLGGIIVVTLCVALWRFLKKVIVR